MKSIKQETATKNNSDATPRVVCQIEHRYKMHFISGEQVHALYPVNALYIFPGNFQDVYTAENLA